MLLHQQSRWHQHRNLLTVLHRLKSRPNGNLGFSVTHIAADQPIHRDFALHINFHFINARELIGGFDISECIFELALPRSVGPEGVALGRLAGSVEADQLTRYLLNRLAGPTL